MIAAVPGAAPHLLEKRPHTLPAKKPASIEAGCDSRDARRVQTLAVCSGAFVFLPAFRILTPAGTGAAGGGAGGATAAGIGVTAAAAADEGDTVVVAGAAAGS